jgi:electron transport complex protein RnfC
VKGTSGVLALTEREIGSTQPAPCIRCSSCVRACPVGLLPLEMAAHIRSGNSGGAVSLGLKDCIACGCCSFVCPSHIPLVHYFSFAKGELMEQERGKLKQEATKKLADERIARTERIAREREEAAAKRKAARAARELAAKAIQTNGHGNDVTADNEIHHARSPLSNFPPQAGERANESLSEIQVKTEAA